MRSFFLFSDRRLVLRIVADVRRVGLLRRQQEFAGVAQHQPPQREVQRRHGNLLHVGVAVVESDAKGVDGIVLVRLAENSRHVGRLRRNADGVLQRRPAASPQNQGQSPIRRSSLLAPRHLAE